MFKLIGKEINAILGAQTILIWAFDYTHMHLFLYQIYHHPQIINRIFISGMWYYWYIDKS